MHRNKDDPRTGTYSPDDLRRFGACDPRHGDVEEDEIRFQRLSQVDRTHAIARLTDDLDAGYSLEIGFEIGPEHLAVVRDKHGEGVCRMGVDLSPRENFRMRFLYYRIIHDCRPFSPYADLPNGNTFIVIILSRRVNRVFYVFLCRAELR